MNTSPLTLILADDHYFFRFGLRAILHCDNHIHVLAEAANGKELCLAVEKYHPDVVITDLSMPEMSGLEAIRLIRQHYPVTGIVVLSMHEETALIKEAFQAGAHSYLLKTAGIDEIVKSVQCAKKGKPFYSPAIVEHLGNVVQYLNQDCTLNEREKQIIQLLFQECTSKEISERLHLSKRTVEEYRKHIIGKTASKNAIGVIKYGLRKKIIEL